MSSPQEKHAADREERAMALMWYVLRVQSSREEKIQENLQKRVKSHGLETLFGRMVIPTETVQEIKGGKKRHGTRAFVADPLRGRFGPFEVVIHHFYEPEGKRMHG